MKKLIHGSDTIVEIKIDPIGAAMFLEEQSGIKCDRELSYDEMYIPSRKNLREWKTWYQKKKNLLYWDEKENRIRQKE